MDKDEIIVPAAYNHEMLLCDIQDYPETGNEDTYIKNVIRREHKHKLIVMQMLLYFAASFCGEEYRSEEKLKNGIKVKVDNDELLAGFLFHVSQNSQFDYSWNYLRKRIINYIDFLAEASQFINNVLADINMLASKPRAGADIHVVFDDILDVTLINNAPYVKTKVLWEDFYRVSKVKKEYSFSVVKKDNVLLTGLRKKVEDAEKLYNTALEMIKKTQGKLESSEQ